MRNKQKPKAVAQFDKLGNLIAYYPNIQIAESKTGVPRSSISMNAGGRAKSGGGYVWKYTDEIDYKEPPNAYQRKPIVRLDNNGNVIARYRSQIDAARDTGEGEHNINRQLRRGCKSKRGFIWKYETSYEKENHAKKEWKTNYEKYF